MLTNWVRNYAKKFTRRGISLFNYIITCKGGVDFDCTPLVPWLIFRNINRMDLIFFQSNLWDIRKLFGIGKWHFWPLKKIFQDFEIKIYRKTRWWFTTVVEMDIGLNRIFSKAKRSFVNIFGSMCCLIVVFFEHKDMILHRFSNILNIVIRRTENFLKAFEKYALGKYGFL